MKKLLVFMMALAMTFSLAACGGTTASTKETPSASTQTESVSVVPTQTESVPAVSTQTGEAEFTAEQQALAVDFMSMAEEYDAIADKVNASPELLENEELVTAMNDLADEIIKADEYFASPETLTPEVMGALRVAVDTGRAFIAEASAALEESGQ